MKFLAVEKEKPGLKPCNFQPHLRDEALKVLEFYRKGYFREIYYNEDKNAVIILECENLTEASSILDSLPLVRAGLIEFKIMQLNPYNGFSRILG